ncbi:MAG: hypothetical protein NC203_04175 [Firmicutes bacterium]|nr:hypothetical protein [[Eubacterium] siraeum]MCM1487546.1 hypothetical protein [Bacillota bacterium]
MKNKLSFILTILFIISTFSACSAEQVSDGDTPSQVPEPAVTEAFVRNTSESAGIAENAESGGINIDEITYAEIDRFLEAQKTRNDELAIEYFSFKIGDIDSGLTVVYSAEHFDAAAAFTVRPSNPEEYKKANPDGEEDYWGNIRLLRWFEIEKNGEGYEVTGMKAEVGHEAYLAEHLLNAFAADTVPTPDGGSADKKEAVMAYRNNFDRPALKFDFGFLRYGSPLFQCSIDDPDAYDFDTESFASPLSREIDDPEFFKVKAGDVLKCGLTVAKADWDVGYQSGSGVELQASRIECKGEVAWEGILHRYTEEDYMIEKGDLCFYPDPLKNGEIPVICAKNWLSEETDLPKADLVAPVWTDAALESGGGSITVGNCFASEDTYDGIFDSGDTVRVKLTLKNLVFETDESGSRTYAEVIGCERA